MQDVASSSPAPSSSACEVLIVGGGAIGVCAAHYLRARGKSVTLVERHELSAGASDGNAGMIVPSHVVPMAAPGVIAQGMKLMFDRGGSFYIKPRLSPELFGWLWRFRGAATQSKMESSMPILHGLLQASLREFSTLDQTEGLSIGLNKDGLLILFTTEHGGADCRVLAQRGRSQGLDIRDLDPDALRELDPNLKASVLGGIYFPQDAHIDPGNFVRQLAAFAQQKGAEIRTQTEVTDFIQEGGKLVGVRTSQGEIRAEQIILATGAWSPQLGRKIGVKLPIQGAKGYSFTAHCPGTKPRVPIILEERHVTVTPMGDRLRFAGTLELAGLDPSINRNRANSILRVIPEYIDGFRAEDIRDEQIWSGYRPCTPDGLPVIGRSERWNNLIVATGHAMIGLSLAPVTGRLVAELASGAEPHLDLAPMSVDRF